ncbi:MAG TPA: DUF4149 domain-containing protein [Candidatus Acidoferrales bacterium]|nr:DUF4149 domain-containing protein [Candidatus Acidoferrales bacterium]
MTSILRFLAVLALSTWIGGSFFLMFFVAPDAFRLLPTPDLAGAVVGLALARLHLVAMVAALVYLVCHTWLLHNARALVRPAALLVFVMVILTAASQYGVAPRMADLRQQMVAEHGSVAATPRTSPTREAFAHLHVASVGLELSTLLLGLGVLFITVRRMGNEARGTA